MLMLDPTSKDVGQNGHETINKGNKNTFKPKDKIDARKLRVVGQSSKVNKKGESGRNKATLVEAKIHSHILLKPGNRNIKQGSKTKIKINHCSQLNSST